VFSVVGFQSGTVSRELMGCLITGSIFQLGRRKINTS
jgi:hypothetical protein